MKVTRKNFLKLSGAASAAALLGSASLTFLSGCRKSAVNKLKGTKEKISICPMCSMGCGITVSVKDGKIININGDSRHPINKGKLCAKGSAAFQLGAFSDKRLTKVMHRPPYAADWQEITWEEAVKKIATKIKDTRDKTFVEYEGKNSVNRTAGLAFFSGSSLNNEEYYLLSKMARILGSTSLTNDSAFSYSAAGESLAKSFGYSAMTNHWIDIKNADVVLIIGSNPAETHPVSAKLIIDAKNKGGKVIHVDPRFTRTSSIADIYAPLRPGTDIAFTGGLINYAIQNDRINKEYVLEYTNAAFIINSDYRFQNGVFSGFKAGKYDNSTWAYESDRKGVPRIDRTLKNNNSVLQIIKAHYSRYTPDVVSRITGCPADLFVKIAEIVTDTFRPEKAAAILFSSGATQHTTGAQAVRAFAILQMLLGNIGVAGGGLNALRQGANEQGADDHGIMTNILPGYLPAPVSEKHTTLTSYIRAVSPVSNNPMSINILGKTEIQMINLLKAYYGTVATKESDYCFHWLPKISRSQYHKSIFPEMQKGIIKGAFLAGANPAMKAPNTEAFMKAMENLEWMAVSDIFETESAAFWKRPGARTEKIKTEVFLLPAASGFEKEGSLTNSGRWVQWREKAANAPGLAKPDLWMIDKIFRELMLLYAEDKNGAFPDSITRANWDYAGDKSDPDPYEVGKEISGYEINSRIPLNGFEQLKDDGSTAAGNWLYCGSMNENGMMPGRRSLREKGSKLGLFPGWAWSWPDNSRVLYNRAGVNRNGKPWNPDKQLLEWDDEWEGDTVNGGKKAGPSEKNPFILPVEGVGRIFVNDMADGPLPEHYEPMETPGGNPLNGITYNPVSAALKQTRLGNSNTYPYIATVYNIAEQWEQGAYTGNISWLSELAPELFCEISQTLANVRGIKNGDTVSIRSARGKLSARCIVTERIQQLHINGKNLEMVGIVMNSGSATSVNCFNNLAHDIGDANTGTPEYKAFLVNISREA